MAELLTRTEPFSTADFLADDNIARADETVREIFTHMLALTVSPASEAGSTEPAPDTPELTAIVGYSGAMRGACEVQMNLAATATIASAMLGGIPVEDSDSLNDAIGEICNMIAGGWKDRVPSLSALCALSPPTLISGSNYRVQMSRPSSKLTRCYRFGPHALLLTLRREDAPSTPHPA